MASSSFGLSAGLKTSLYSLQDLTQSINQSNTRLSTGKKVNSALDNALNYFLADAFSTKSTALSTVLDGINLGINTVKQATTALDSIKTSLAQAQGTLQAALNSAGTQARVTTNFALKDSSGNAVTASTASTVTVIDPTASNRSRIQTGDKLTVSIATISVTGSQTVLSAGTALTFAAGTTVQNLLDNINTNTTLNPAGQSQRVRAYIGDAGNIVIESALNGDQTTATTSTYALKIDFDTTAAAVATQGNELTAFTFTGAPGNTPNLTTGAAINQTTYITGDTKLQTTRSSAATSFRTVLDQLRQTALDAGYNGTNLLQGDFLTVKFNDSGTTSIVTQGQRVDSNALGFTIDTVAALTGDSVYNFQSDSEIKSALTKIATATNSVNALSTSFATNFNLISNRQNYTTSFIRNLNDGADALTLADINAEGANLSSLQTKQQLSVQALSLANRSDQAILRLLQ